MDESTEERTAMLRALADLDRQKWEERMDKHNRDAMDELFTDRESEPHHVWNEDEKPMPGTLSEAQEELRQAVNELEDELEKAFKPIIEWAENLMERLSKLKK